MKVGEIIKKVNFGTMKLPVYLFEGAFGPGRKVDRSDFYIGAHYLEESCTVSSISILEDRIIIHYSWPKKGR